MTARVTSAQPVMARTVASPHAVSEPACNEPSTCSEPSTCNEPSASLTAPSPPAIVAKITSDAVSESPTADLDAAAAPSDVRLAELELIQEYRTGTASSVDDFHRFLISLGASSDGRFWALVACLLTLGAFQILA
jgi:hypothetical protein